MPGTYSLFGHGGAAGVMMVLPLESLTTSLIPAARRPGSLFQSRWGLDSGGWLAFFTTVPPWSVDIAAGAALSPPCSPPVNPLPLQKWEKCSNAGYGAELQRRIRRWIASPRQPQIDTPHQGRPQPPPASSRPVHPPPGHKKLGTKEQTQFWGLLNNLDSGRRRCSCRALRLR